MSNIAVESLICFSDWYGGVCYVGRTMQLVSKDCPSPASDGAAQGEVGEIRTKATVLWGFLNTAFYLLLFKLKYCYKTSSVQTSAVSLTLKGSAIL